MTFDTISLQSFIAVADSGSFTKAADKVGRTQSAISQQIAKLESLTDKKLFNRDKNLTLTQDGQIFLNYARDIYKMHIEAIEHFKHPELHGEVRFGIPEDFASVFLYDVLKEFTQIHPRISLHIECDLTLNLYNNFKKDKFDLVLLKMAKPKGEALGSDLMSEKLNWVGNEKLLKNNNSIPLVLSPKPCMYREAAIKALDQKKIKWHIAFSSHSFAGTIAAVKAGLGVTVLPYKMIPKDLKIIKSAAFPALNNSHVSLLKLNSDNQAVNSFEEFVIKHLNKS